MRALQFGLGKILAAGALAALTLGLLLGCSNTKTGDDDDDSAPGAGTVSADWRMKSAGNFEVHFATYANQCSLEQSGSDKQNSRVIEIQLTPPAGQSEPASGTYPVLADNAAGVATAEIKVFDASCSETKINGTGGSVTLDGSLTGTATVGGSYTLHFEDGSSQSGDFDASFCDRSVSTGTSMCMP